MSVMTLPAETQRRTRGHNFYPPKAVTRRIPAMLATEGTSTADKTLWLKYFTGSWTWYVAEFDAETGRAFGYAIRDGEGSWGNFSLPEMERFRPTASGGGIRWVVERDLDFTPRKASEVTL